MILNQNTINQIIISICSMETMDDQYSLAQIEYFLNYFMLSKNTKKKIMAIICGMETKNKLYNITQITWLLNKYNTEETNSYSFRVKKKKRNYLINFQYFYIYYII